ncbi:MAG: hypothetical protein WA419_12650 [Silvibacterium sp.]
MANPTSIIVGSNTYSLVQMPASPGPKGTVLSFSDTVAQVTSPFTLQTQTQQWPGADRWSAQFTLPPMPRSQAVAWSAWLKQLRGTLCVFQLGGGDAATPLGTPMGAPQVDGTVDTNNTTSTSVLYTKGWQPNT